MALKDGDVVTMGKEGAVSTLGPETRAVLVLVSDDIRRQLHEQRIRLPEGVHIDAERERLEVDAWQLRLRGIGLPDWVKRPLEAARFPDALLTPTSPTTVSIDEI